MVKVEVEVKSFPATGGDGPCSYVKNSRFQRLTANLVKDKIVETIMEKMDGKTLSSPSNRFCIADLGCATGPNTTIFMEHVIEAVKQNIKSKSPSSPLPEFHVFFNDLPSNDFNTLFTFLPQDKSYFAAGVPGSFYDRLFPESSVHFMLSFSALHWLSRAPEELLNENSPAFNKGRVHYSNAPEAVLRAYEDQFDEDMRRFLEARGKEIVSGGMLVIGMCGIPLGMPFSNLAAGVQYEAMATILIEMQEEGLVSEALLDSFNLTIYAATPEQVSSLVEKDGCFEIEIMELMNPTANWLNGPINITETVMNLRAAMGEVFVTHFGTQVTDELFKRLITKLTDAADKLESGYRDKIMLFAILKRK